MAYLQDTVGKIASIVVQNPFNVVLVWCAYLLVVRLLRYRRAAALPLKHGIHNRDAFSRLTANQAQSVLKDLVELEFPKFMGFSIVFALFKTYGIPSVSSLLSTTGELASPITASKRTADTSVLLFEFCLNKPSSDRATEAVARMNYLHNRYIKAGKISNDDMLYTLSVFALEPVRWIARYEWREFTDFELCAIGTFWKSLGDEMQIDFAALASSSDGWKDGLHWLEEVRTWSERYEEDHMVPADSNHRLALAHLDVIFVNLPSYLKIAGHRVVAVLVGDRLRAAMGLAPAPKAFEVILKLLLSCRKFVLKHVFLPRPEFKRKSYVSMYLESNGHYSSKEYLSHPWYVKPTFARRWGPKAWFARLLGRKVPGDDGNQYNPEGYLISEIGPKHLAQKGKEEMDSELERIKVLQPGTCSFGPVGDKLALATG